MSLNVEQASVWAKPDFTLCKKGNTSFRSPSRVTQLNSLALVVLPHGLRLGLPGRVSTVLAHPLPTDMVAEGVPSESGSTAQ